MRSQILILLLAAATIYACDGEGDTSISPPPLPDGDLTPIFDVQGRGHRSPLEGEQVALVGIVTGDFQDGDQDDQSNLGGFFLQEAITDDDFETSDGVFVFDRNSQTIDVSIGKQVRVEGTVTERFGETQIVAESVFVIGRGKIDATVLDFPASTMLNADERPIADLERVEGMLVMLETPADISDLRNLERYGEIQLGTNGRLWQFTDHQLPDVAGYANHKNETASRSLILDDGLAVQNPSTLRYIDGRNAGRSIRIGDSVSVSAGNIRFSRGSGGNGTEAYRLIPTTDPVFVSRNPRPTSPPRVGGIATVASFNVLNYFTNLDIGKDNCGPSENHGCRGADSADEFTRQSEKIIHALLMLDADIIGLIEIENNGGSSIENIADSMNARPGIGGWESIKTGNIGNDAIAVGLVYRRDRAEPVGDFAVLDSSVDERFNDQKNRPTLAQTFLLSETDNVLTVAVSHLKSKGSDCDDVNDVNRNDGQGNCNQTRTDAVLAMIDWLESDPTKSGDPDILVVGDMNAYLKEDPIRAFEDAGYVNLLSIDTEQPSYSFVFDGQSGTLDHALASPSLADKIAAAAEWHINADETPLYDYNLEFGRDEELFDASGPFRASDHDPILVGIN